MIRQERFEERKKTVLQYLQEHKREEWKVMSVSLDIPNTSMRRVLNSLKEENLIKKIYIDNKKPSVRKRVFWEIIE